MFAEIGLRQALVVKRRSRGEHATTGDAGVDTFFLIRESSQAVSQVTRVRRMRASRFGDHRPRRPGRRRSPVRRTGRPGPRPTPHTSRRLKALMAMAQQRFSALAPAPGQGHHNPPRIHPPFAATAP